MTQLFERLIKQRGFTENYICPRYEDLADPFLLPEMEQAVKRIEQAILAGDKIIIYGDYDVDGVTASVVMFDTLKLAGVEPAKIIIRLPDRFKDGYGMSKGLVEEAKRAGVKLVITVDCGSANREIVEGLAAEGIETIITDHHECPAELPKAVAVINPKRKDSYKKIVQQNLGEEAFAEAAEKLVGLREMAGVGVAFTVARALMKRGKIPAGQEKWLLDLVAIGTLCDSMKMNGENRILGYYGMKVLGKTRRVGLQELLRRVKVGKIGAEVINFQIGPRLNAAGRMASAEIALKLLMAEKRSEAASLAEELEKLNSLRKREQELAVEAVKTEGVGQEPVLIVRGNWHEGILGIVAGRLVEEYKRPAFVLTEKDGILKGSGRSFGDFSLAEALSAVAGTIIGGGGHAGAAGVKIASDKFEEFKEEINKYYTSLNLRDQERFWRQDADLRVEGAGEFSEEFLREIESLEPFGVGNEVPVFEMPEILVTEKRLMGAEGEHLSLRVRGEDARIMKMVAFNAPEAWKQIREGERTNILFNIEENEWKGLKSVEGRILGIEAS